MSEGYEHLYRDANQAALQCSGSAEHIELRLYRLLLPELSYVARQFIGDTDLQEGVPLEVAS